MHLQHVSTAAGQGVAQLEHAGVLSSTRDMGAQQPASNPAMCFGVDPIAVSQQQEKGDM